MASWSLSRRLVLVLTASMMALWLVAAAAAALIMENEIDETFDDTLQESARRLLPLAVHDLRDYDWDADDRTVADTSKNSDHDEYLVYQVRQASGGVLLRSHDAPDEPFPVPLKRGFTEVAGWRYYTEGTDRGDIYLQVAEPLTHRNEAIQESLIWLGLPLVPMLPIAVIIIFATVGRAMRPIGAISRDIGARGGSDLSPIPHSGLPRELSPIVEDVNHLLVRLDTALAGERAFAANSAHELRTPVASALAQTQRLATELRSTPHGERIDHIADTLHRLGDLVEKLLQLSRAEAGVALGREPTDVLPALELVIDEFVRRPGSDRRIRFDPGGHDMLKLRIDVDAFAIVVRNLIDNGLRHGPGGGVVDVSVMDDGAIRIVNGGAAVPPDQLARLTGRFERGGGNGRAGAEGSGLGLAIVETIMTQADGTLTLHSPAPGRPDGFAAEVRFQS